jgi:hypothetical protein
VEAIRKRLEGDAQADYAGGLQQISARSTSPRSAKSRVHGQTRARPERGIRFVPAARYPGSTPDRAVAALNYLAATSRHQPRFL